MKKTMDKAEMLALLNEHLILKERVDNGVDVHPNEATIMKFEQLALTISPNGDFSWRGCLPCVNHIFKFVYSNLSKLGFAIAEGAVLEAKKATTIKQDEPEKTT
jgi:hypothetical protein